MADVMIEKTALNKDSSNGPEGQLWKHIGPELEILHTESKTDAARKIKGLGLRFEHAVNSSINVLGVAGGTLFAQGSALIL